MIARIRPSEPALQEVELTLRRDLQTISRSEQLLQRARRVRQRIEQRVRQVLNQDRPGQPPGVC